MPSTGDAKKRLNKNQNRVRNARLAIEQARRAVLQVHRSMEQRAPILALTVASCSSSSTSSSSALNTDTRNPVIAHLVTDADRGVHGQFILSEPDPGEGQSSHESSLIQSPIDPFPPRLPPPPPPPPSPPSSSSPSRSSFCVTLLRWSQIIWNRLETAMIRIQPCSPEGGAIRDHTHTHGESGDECHVQRAFRASRPPSPQATGLSHAVRVMVPVRRPCRVRDLPQDVCHRFDPHGNDRIANSDAISLLPDIYGT